MQIGPWEINGIAVIILVLGVIGVIVVVGGFVGAIYFLLHYVVQVKRRKDLFESEDSSDVRPEDSVLRKSE